jgi:hypothetical protein
MLGLGTTTKLVKGGLGPDEIGEILSAAQSRRRAAREGCVWVRTVADFDEQVRPIFRHLFVRYVQGIRVIHRGGHGNE